jgi:hypothetical protein
MKNLLKTLKKFLPYLRDAIVAFLAANQFIQ